MSFSAYERANGRYFEGMLPGHDVSEGPAFSNAVAVVKITNLEEACARIVELNQTAMLGIDVTRKLHTVIEGLKEAWKGSDAVVHIHNMIAWKSMTGSLGSMALSITEQMHMEMMRMNEKQIANGGKEVYTGSITTTPMTDYLKDSEDPVDNGEVFVDTVAARVQLQNLKEAQSMFFDFFDKYSRIHSFIAEIWQEGGGRDALEDAYQQFVSQIDMMREEWPQAISALEQAIQNWEA